MNAAAKTLSIIGRSVHRIDGIDKVTGKAKYTGDVAISGMVEGKFLRSPYAHARILSIDASEAEGLAGVIAVLSSKDFTDGILYVGRGKDQDQPIIAANRVIFAGRQVAAVAATELAIAEEALADGAPRIHSFAERNICFEAELVKGDVEKGFIEADEIFEDTFEFPMVYHFSMEPHAVIAKVDDEGITVWTSNSHPFGVRQELAEIFHFPLSAIRVHVNFVGGAYGSKSGCKIEPLVVAVARKAGRPVRVVQNISEAMAICRRHAVRCRIKSGVKRDGTLTAKEAEIYLDTGAYAETGPVVTGRTLTRILGPYRVPNIKVHSYCIYTNTVSAASFRSIGGPLTAWATESQMDIIAQRLGLDPVDLRLINLLRKGEEIKPKGKPLDADLFKGLKLVTERLGWAGPVTKDARGRGQRDRLEHRGAAQGAAAHAGKSVAGLARGKVVVRQIITKGDAHGYEFQGHPAGRVNAEHGFVLC